jgi:hypothetical protein
MCSGRQSVSRDSALHSCILRLRAGEVVEIRTRDEILATLDENGRLDALPFMPEMLKYCGQRFKVFRRADKTCDTIEACASRRMKDAVHLEALRCDGGAHDGCQAGCLLFWKEAWLKRVERHVTLAEYLRELSSRMRRQRRRHPSVTVGCTGERLVTATRVIAVTGETTYCCQSTELNKATTPLQWWDLTQYFRELRSGNVRLAEFIRVIGLAVFNALQRHTGGRVCPSIQGSLTKTPTSVMNLQAGDIVQVKTKEDIEGTLDTSRKNRGLLFDREMVKYCGGRYRVLRRVEKIIDEKSRKLIQLPRDCIVLDGVTCRGDVSRNRLFCPRSIYPYWREIWLTRLDDDQRGRESPGC